MNNLKKKKLFKYSSLCAFSLLTFIPTLQLLNQKLNLSNLKNTLNSIDFQQQNDQLEMSKNIGFPIYTIQKTGHDAKRINFLIIGNGYKKNELQKFTDYVNKFTQTFLNSVPYKQFSHLINIYAILATEEDDSKHYFDVVTISGIYDIASIEKTKIKNIVDKLENSFLDKGGQIDDVALVTTNRGREVAYPWADTEFDKKWLNIIQGNVSFDDTYVHETGHSFGRLADEYLGGGNNGYWPNLAYSKEAAKEKWGEFFGFRGIGIIQMREGLFRPSNSCIMISSYGQFCEVCKYHLFLKLKQLTESRGNEKKDLYVANPSITIKHEVNDYYQELAEENVYGTKPITEAQNKEIDFSTVIHNFTTSKKNFKLKLKIENKNKNTSKEWEQDFEVQPNELKKLTLFTEIITPSIYQIEKEDKIYGEVIDLSTNKVIESRKTYSERFLDYKNVTLRYKLYENNTTTNQDVPSTFLGNKYFSLKNETKFTINPPTLKGYKYKQSNLNNLTIVAKENVDITLYYEKLPSKTFTIQLKDEEGNVVETKEQTIYENEVFVPSFYDFFIVNEIRVELDNKKSIPESNKTWKYNEIEDKKLLLTYNMVPDETPMFNHFKVVLDYGSTWDPEPYRYTYSYLWLGMEQAADIIKNEVNTRVPGIYYVSYLSNLVNWRYDGVDVSARRNNTIKVIVKNQDGSLPNEDNIDEQLNSEKAKIDSTLFYLMKWRYKSDEISSINDQNLFEKFVYGLKKQSDFTYQVINLNKNEKNKIKFNLKIKKGEKSIDSNEISLFYKNIDSIQPNPDPDFEKLEEEKNRINNLNLSLKKEIYNQDEIEGINSTNLFNELNGWNSNNEFLYEIVDFTNNNTNKIDFKIKIIKNEKYSYSKLFSLFYQLSSQPIDPILEELKNEKNKIDNSNLALVKEEYTQNEIDNLTSETLMKELKNLDLDNNKYNYLVVNFKKDVLNKNISFQIQISKDEKSIITNEFNLNYKLSSLSDNNKSNNLPIILSATIVPISLVILGLIGYTFIKIKKNK